MKRLLTSSLAFALMCLLDNSQAQTTYTITTSADAFLATGAAGNPLGTDLTAQNFGGAGALVVGAAAGVKGEFQTLLKFDLSAMSNSFNTVYGTNGWIVTGISLELTGNFGAAGEQPNNSVFPAISGGIFAVEWLSDDSWVEGTGTPNLPTTDGVSYSSVPGLLASAHTVLCTNTYLPPGDNVHVTYPLPLDTNLVADVMASGNVSFRLYALDNQLQYLFNSYFYGRGNQPLIHVAANFPPPVILPGTFTNGVYSLTGTGTAGALYQVQVSTSLAATNWQSLAAVPANGAGLIQFNDTNAVSHSQRFYRLAR